VAAGLAAGAVRARADTATARLEPSYDAVNTTTTDATGTTTHTSSDTLTQRYYLTLDKTLYSNLRLGASGIYQWALGSSSGGNLPPSEFDNRLWNADVRLTAGDPLLNGTASYTAGETSARSLSAGLLTSTPTLFHDTAAVSSLWRPDELPQLQFLFTRDTAHDLDRTVTDTSQNQAVLQSIFRPDPRFDLRGRLLWSNPIDHLHDVDSTTFGEEARVGYGQDFLDRRLNVYSSYIFGATQIRTTATGTGGTVLVPQYPILGLSIVEAFPATPTNVKLSSNPALIDADTTTSAGLNIGFTPSVNGDTANRDIGAQFANTITPVNMIYVWVDKPLPTAVASAYHWTAYTSDDNQNWTEIAIDQAKVTFGIFQNRFEIPLTQVVQVRYLKVVTKPLAVGVTTDQTFAIVNVTEIQFLQALAAGTARQVNTVTGFFTGTSRYQIIRSQLYLDSSLSLTHATNAAHILWSVSNGLSYLRRLTRILDLSARVDRSDANDAQNNAVGSTRWTGSLTFDPLPTLGGNLTYSGNWDSPSPSGTVVNNSLSLFGRAVPYQGISLFASLVYALSQHEVGRDQESESANAGVSLVPNPKLTLNGTYSYSRTAFTGGGEPSQVSDSWRVEGDVTVSPFPALYANAGVTRVMQAGVGQTLVNVSGNLSPFPGGNLILTFRYNQTLDTLTDTKTLIWGPYVRWNITPRSYVETTYQVLDVTSPTLETSSRSFNARFSLLL
jgi:hypothetical protein